MDVESRLMELNLTLPEPAKPAFNYVPVTVWQDVAHERPASEGRQRSFIRESPRRGICG